ncbi:MAG: hypothetical protein U9Q15_03685 [Patescibacteria group bacterium]|nr:hypothetical protein [Patescibacteria group bacterium]
MLRVFLFLLGASAIIFFLTITFQNYGNGTLFFFLTSMSNQLVGLITPMMFSFLMGAIAAGSFVGAIMSNAKKDADPYDTSASDGW